MGDLLGLFGGPSVPAATAAPAAAPASGLDDIFGGGLLGSDAPRAASGGDAGALSDLFGLGMPSSGPPPTASEPASSSPLFDM
eukprot:gene28785-30053_t